MWIFIATWVRTGSGIIRLAGENVLRLFKFPLKLLTSTCDCVRVFEREVPCEQFWVPKGAVNYLPLKYCDAKHLTVNYLYSKEWIDLAGIVSFRMPRDESFISTSKAWFALKIKFQTWLILLKFKSSQTHLLYKTAAVNPSGRKNDVAKIDLLEDLVDSRIESGIKNLEKWPIA